MPKISKCVPEIGKNLASYTGKEVIDKIGEETVKELITDILCGSNVRALTEGLTRRRLILSNSSLLMTYLKAHSSIENFSSELSNKVSRELVEEKLSKEEKLYLQWLIGLTGKSIQNVLRSNPEEMEKYLSELEESLEEMSEESKEVFGDLIGYMEVDGNKLSINWPVISQIFMAIGAQTLAIRGAEKSMYGKLFEKLILGSILSLLGFKLVSSNDASQSTKVFWLSDRGEKRESDATLLYKPGVAIRFDIGFIGPGNTEISLDKVSRFEKEAEIGNKNHFIGTIVIVDRIGDKSRIVDLAKAIDGQIVQMSMNYWVKEVANILKDSLGFVYQIAEMKDGDSIRFIKQGMQNINLQDFV